MGAVSPVVVVVLVGVVVLVVFVMNVVLVVEVVVVITIVVVTGVVLWGFGVAFGVEGQRGGRPQRREGEGPSRG